MLRTLIIMPFLNAPSSETERFLQHCKNHQVRFSQTTPTTFRAVFHLDITKEDMLKAVNIINDF